VHTIGAEEFFVAIGDPVDSRTRRRQKLSMAEQAERIQRAKGAGGQVSNRAVGMSGLIPGRPVARVALTRR